MKSKELEQKAKAHALKVLGPEQFENNPDAVASVALDFIEGWQARNEEVNNLRLGLEKIAASTGPVTTRVKELQSIAEHHLGYTANDIIKRALKSN